MESIDKSKIRVLFIDNDYQNKGGAGKSLVELLEGLIYYVEIFVIIPRKGPKEDYYRKKNIQCRIVEFENDFGFTNISIENKRIRNLKNNYNAALNLKKFVTDYNIDIIHSNSSVGNVGIILSMMTGIPHVWHIRECLKIHYNYDYWDEILKQELFNISDAVISISETVHDYLLDKYNTESFIVYDGIDASQYLSPLNTDNCNYRYYYIGGITSDKGVWTILEAVKYIKKVLKQEIKVIIAGDHSDKAYFAVKKFVERYKLEANIEIIGYQNDLRYIRKIAGNCIVASKFEALSRSTVEAMYAGNIVIASDRGGTKELIGDNERGLLFRCDDYKDLAKQMIVAAQMTNIERSVICEKAQSYAIDNFSIDKSASSVLQVYKRLIFYKNNNNRKQELYCEIIRRIDLNEESLNISCVNVIKIDIDDFPLVSKKILDLINNKRCDKIAIYGMGKLGLFLYDYLYERGISIVYVIDKQPMGIEKVIEVLNPNDKWRPVDVIINTVTHGYDIVDKLIEEKGFFRIGLSDFV